VEGACAGHGRGGGTCSAFCTRCTVFLRSASVLIFTEIGMPPPRSRAWRTMSLTVSGFFSSAAPTPSLIAHCCGQPQLRSTPATLPASSSVAAANCEALSAANCTISGLSYAFVFISTSRARCDAANDSAMIIGVYTMSQPQDLTTCRKGSREKRTMGAAMVTHFFSANRRMMSPGPSSWPIARERRPL